ncbi:PREDICTED: serine/threonine-protein phosphatase PPQ-like, partial [Rhagoletis zephyria]|uniref:serine/threonine-protein phosphatase PPQ-like n=1 Tax=Rhagoletis zephyria TaxID=28612 RepID=UPI000811558C
MTRHRYSLENVFRENSVANIFYTLVRDKEGKLGGGDAAQGAPGNRGLLSADSDGDQDTLLRYIEVLCFQVRTIVRLEPKLLRLAGPVHVIGDIRGSLADLFALEHCLFPAVPSLSQTVLFLGNYSDSSAACQSWGTECIFYLMALKLLMPNKVYLLRGRYELAPFNVAHLGRELAEKYGQAMGDKVVGLLNGVFQQLPLAATIEESILCTHSGIPQLPAGKTLLEVLTSKEMEQAEGDPVEKMAPAAYEIITNMPTNYANSPEFYLEGKQIFHPSFVKDSKENCSYFNGEAFGDFMRANKFDMFVRSHNPCK